MSLHSVYLSTQIFNPCSLISPYVLVNLKILIFPCSSSFNPVFMSFDYVPRGALYHFIIHLVGPRVVLSCTDIHLFPNCSNGHTLLKGDTYNTFTVGVDRVNFPVPICIVKRTLLNRDKPLGRVSF